MSKKKEDEGQKNIAKKGGIVARRKKVLCVHLQQQRQQQQPSGSRGCVYCPVMCVLGDYYLMQMSISAQGDWNYIDQQQLSNHLFFFLFIIFIAIVVLLFCFFVFFLLFFFLLCIGHNGLDKIIEFGSCCLSRTIVCRRIEQILLGRRRRLPYYYI